MGTVPIGTGELRTIQERMLWMFLPVERSITVSAPQRIAHTIFSTSSATPELTAELPMLALTLTRKLRPIAIGSSSRWLMLAGMIARPSATSRPNEFRRDEVGDSAPKISPSAMVAAALDRRLARKILPMRDIDHLFGDDSGACEFVLGDELTGLAGAQRPGRRTVRREAVGRNVAVVFRLHRAAMIA